jgi:hypothetical protein
MINQETFQEMLERIDDHKSLYSGQLRNHVSKPQFPFPK